MAEKIRTRFAPSPTGWLHLGNARTAIFNYLFAKHNNGDLILRIEDTDRERSKKEYEEAIIEDLKWLGIEWDEGPDKGGPYGPYRQSERFEIYKKYVDKLLESGHAYRCFCTPEELEAEREKARKEGRPYRYSGKCRHLTPEQVEQYLKEGRPYTIRFRVPDGRELVLNDIVKGEVRFNVDDFGDFVIVRSDGSPVYNFVVVVDDALMKITHVIRGEDHLANTFKQMLIYEALGFPMPKFAHLPIILGEDRSKLSKRHGAVSVRQYRFDGYLPEALFNFLSLLGWYPKDGKEILSKEELIERFDISDIHNAPAVFNKEKLYWMNGIYIREVLDLDDLTDRVIDYLKTYKDFLDEEDKPVAEIILSKPREFVKEVISKTRDSFFTLKEFPKRAKPFFVEEFELTDDAKKHIEKVTPEVAKQIVNLYLQKVREMDTFTGEDFKKVAKKVAKELKLKPGMVFKTLRVVLTGETQGVSLDLLVDVIGKETVERRLERFLSFLQ
jgi:glutamyl-tRNA synthetase/nondiscriminating glutamyl-tRNA synthetase